MRYESFLGHSVSDVLVEYTGIGAMLCYADSFDRCQLELSAWMCWLRDCSY
jgi:hypothetical protein